MSGSEKTSVVDMWRALEFFTPQTFSNADSQDMFPGTAGAPVAVGRGPGEPGVTCR